MIKQLEFEFNGIIFFDNFDKLMIELDYQTYTKSTPPIAVAETILIK